jgi:hypothetical protein
MAGLAGGGERSRRVRRQALQTKNLRTDGGNRREIDNHHSVCVTRASGSVTEELCFPQGRRSTGTLSRSTIQNLTTPHVAPPRPGQLAPLGQHPILDVDDLGETLRVPNGKNAAKRAYGILCSQ